MGRAAAGMCSMLSYQGMPLPVFAQETSATKSNHNRVEYDSDLRQSFRSKSKLSEYVKWLENGT